MDNHENEDDHIGTSAEGSETNTKPQQTDPVDEAGQRAFYPSDELTTAPPAMIHEMGVQGSVIKQTVDFLDEYSKPEQATFTLENGEIVPVTLSRNGLQVLDSDKFNQWRDRPVRRSGRAQLRDLDSFINHLNRFKDGDSAAFALNDRANPSIHSVIDYHRIGHESAPRWGQHTSSFTMPLDKAWKAWKAIDGEAMSMVEFAGFLENQIIDVMDISELKLTDEQALYVKRLGGEGRIASPAKLMEISTNLQIREESDVTNSVTLSSGEGVASSQSQHVDGMGKPISVPSMFVIAVPVFENGPLYQVIVRLRYRKLPTGLVFFVEQWRADRVFDHAFDEALQRVRDETELPVFLGSPE